MTLTTHVELALQPVLKSLVYATLAGEFLRNTGLTDNDQLNAVQQAVAEGLVEKVFVFARRPDGGVEDFEFRMIPPAAGETLDLALVAGKSMLETVDVALAASVKEISDMLVRRGLKPEYKVGWSARVRVNPALGAEAIKRLNLRAEPLPTPPPPIAAMPIYEPVHMSPPVRPTPQRYAHTINTYTGPPVIPPAQVYKQVLEIKAARDPNISLTWRTSVPKT